MKLLFFIHYSFPLSVIQICVAQVGMGTTTPHASSVLDITSTTRGFLPPRMSHFERNAITNPAEGLTIFNTTSKFLETYDGVGWTNVISVAVAPTDVFSPATGKIWMVRNLGATQVATTSTDTAAYGDLYQWGRGGDGHQIKTSLTTFTLSSSDTLLDGKFIKINGDWRSPQNNNLWQGVNGVNNPCPSGYRLPTSVEWQAEINSWGSIQNATSAFASPLKLVKSGVRLGSTGVPMNEGTNGYYWTSTIAYDVTSGTYKSFYFLLSDTTATVSNYLNRSLGLSVRCIKN